MRNWYKSAEGKFRNAAEKWKNAEMLKGDKKIKETL